MGSSPTWVVFKGNVKIYSARNVMMIHLKFGHGCRTVGCRVPPGSSLRAMLKFAEQEMS